MNEVKFFHWNFFSRALNVCANMTFDDEEVLNFSQKYVSIVH